MAPAPGRLIGDNRIIFELMTEDTHGSDGNWKDAPDAVTQGCSHFVKDARGGEGTLSC